MSFAGKTLVLTGTLSMKRAEAKALAEGAGAKVTAAVSGNTDFVVAGPDAITTDKILTAKAKGVTVLTEAEFTAKASGKGKAKGKSAAKPAPKPAAKKIKPAAKKGKPAAKKGKPAAAGEDVPPAAATSFAGKTLVLTGTLSMKRAEAKALAEGAGAKVTAAVSGNTDFVVAGPDAITTDKILTAKAKGVTVLTEAEFQAAVSGGALATAPAPAPAPASKKKGPSESADEPPKKAAKKEGTAAAAAAAAGPRARPVDRLVPGREGFSVFEDWTVMLNQTNVGANNNKFYVIQLLTRNGNFWTWNRWGRVGEPGQNSLRSHGANLGAAQRDFEKKFRDKTLNDYHARLNFVKREGKYMLVVMADEEGGDEDKAPVGKLSREQIEKGQSVLESIGGAIASGAGAARLDELSSTFFSLIPTNFGRQRPEPLRTEPQVAEKEALLKFYLRMGFEEVEKVDDGATPISGVMELALPPTLSGAIKLGSHPVAAGAVKAAVTQGTKLASEQKGEPRRPMSAELYASILLYTGNAIYRHLNSVLRAENRSAVRGYFPYLRMLFEAAAALSESAVTLWRGISVDLSKTYKVGSTITWWGVSSCTSEKQVAKNFMGGLSGDASFLTIKAKTACDISKLSFFSNEKESILLPGTQLRVLRCEKKGKVAEIDLEEVGRAVG